jgi:hypothetical protein
VLLRELKPYEAETKWPYHNNIWYRKNSLFTIVACNTPKSGQYSRLGLILQVCFATNKTYILREISITSMLVIPLRMIRVKQNVTHFNDLDFKLSPCDEY